MCGIVGFYTDKKDPVWGMDKIMPELMFANQLRGRDAAGVFGIHKNKPKFCDYAKMVGSADYFLEWGLAKTRFLKRAEHFKFMVAHNRAATIGDKDNEAAAHPHRAGAITLVHNGTLRQYPKVRECISDSQVVAHLLDGEPDFTKVSPEFRGAWAFVWHDDRDNSLNFARNSERPLHFLRTKDDAVVFTSEERLAEWVLDRNHKDVVEKWELPVQKWVKVMEGGEIETVDVPLPSVMSYSDNGKSSRRERRRAQSTLLLPPSIPRDEEARTWAAPEPVAQKTHTTVSNKGDEHLPAGYMGLSQGDEVYIWPQSFEMGKENAIIVEGAVALFGEGGHMEFLHGVKARARVKDAPSNDIRECAEYIRRMIDNKTFFSTTITATVMHHKLNKLTFFAKDAVPEDFGSPTDWGLDYNDPSDAFKGTLPTFSEVEVTEKKDGAGAQPVAPDQHGDKGSAESGRVFVSGDEAEVVELKHYKCKCEMCGGIYHPEENSVRVWTINYKHPHTVSKNQRYSAGETEDVAVCSDCEPAFKHFYNMLAELVPGKVI